MDQATHNKIVSFIWGIADDVLRDLFKRGKYPDVILPMCVIRRMDAVLEPTKKAVLDTKKMLDEARITEQRAALCDAAGQAFYNTSKFTLRDLKSRGSQQQLLADFEDYLNGFSPNVQDILDNFKFRNQLSTLSKADALGTLINKFLDPDIDLSPAGIDNHSMGTVFEELVRKFNEENNEEAGEHWTPRDAVRLMANLVFLPIAEPDQVRHLPALRLRLRHRRHAHRRRGDAHRHRRQARPAGQQPPLRPGDQPRDLRHLQGRHAAQGRGRERRPHRRRRGMVHALARRLPRAGVRLHALQSALRQELEEGPRSDGRQGRHARPALQGDAQGRGALARHPLQRRPDALPRQHGVEDERQVGARQPHRRGPQRLVALHRRRRPGREQHPPLAHRERLARSHRRAAAQPLLQHRHRHLHLGAVQPKPAHRKGQVQLIDATQWFKPLRKNLGKKNCELSPEDIERISRTFLAFKETPESKIFPNAAFGYWKVTVERPLRLHSQLTLKAIETLRFASGDEDLRAALYEEFGDDLFTKLRQGLRRAGEAPGRLGQRRGRGRRRRGRRREEGPAREEEEEAARPQDLGARRPPRRSRHDAARGTGRHALRGPQPLPRPRGRRAQEGRTSSSPPPT